MSGGPPDESWTLTPEDHALAMSKHRRTRLGFAVGLLRSRGRFPRFESAVEPRVIDALGEQLDAPAPAGDGELLTARTAERFRAEIRACFGFREATDADADALIVWLRDHAAPEAAGALDVLVERLETRCREQALKPPAPDRLDRIVRAAQRAHLDRFHTAVYERPPPTGASMNCSYRRPMRANNRLPGKRQVVRLARSFDCAVVQGAQASPACRKN